MTIEIGLTQDESQNLSDIALNSDNLNELSSQTDIETLLGLFLNQVINKFGKIDIAGRFMINVEAGTLPVVTTVSAVTAVTTLNQLGGNQSNAMPSAMSNAGLGIIYSNLNFS